MLNETSYRRRGIAIVNPYGGIWGPNLFDTPADARRYLEQFWHGVTTPDLSKYRLVMAEQTTAFLLAPGSPEFIDMPPTNP